MVLAEWIFGIAWALILYTYIGFPLALALLARLFGANNAEPSLRVRGSGMPEIPRVELDQSLSPPRVAMVVSSHNEGPNLSAKLANTWAIEYPADRFELWIGSDGSTDNTTEILHASSDPRLRYREFTIRRGKISVLNDLLSEIDADVIVMSDANTAYAPDAVCRLIAHFDDPRVGCVSGELSLTQDGGVSGEGLYWRYESWIKVNESRLGFLIGCNGGIFALRRSCFEPLPPSTIVEDFVLTMRVLEHGHRVVFAPDARASEPACDSARSEMMRKVRIGAGGFQAIGLTWRLLLPRFGLAAFAFWGHKVLRWFVPIFLLAATAANVALSHIALFGGALLVQAVGGVVAIAAYYTPSQRFLPRWTRPISYFYLMNYALFWGFLRFLCRTQRVTWERRPHSAVPATRTAAASTSLAD